MSSNINPQNVDGAYPIAGQDNDSQGFRTNFTNIRNNFVAAHDEIIDLQGKAVLLQQLSGGTPVANNFYGTVLNGALTKGFTETCIDLGAVTTGIPVVYANGDVQKFTVNASQALTFDWTGIPSPVAGKYAKLRVWLVITDNAYTVTFPASVNVGTNAVSGLSGSVLTPPIAPVLTPLAPGHYIFEFTTLDGGTNTIIEQVAGVLGTEAAAIAVLESEVAVLQGDVTTLQTDFASNVTTINNHTTAINTHSGQISTINSTLTSNVVLNNTSNTLSGNVISNVSQTASENNAAIGAIQINPLAADFQFYATTGAITLSFASWPTIGNSYYKIRVMFNITNVAHTVTFPGGQLDWVGLTTSNIPGMSGMVWIPPATGYYLFELSKIQTQPATLISALIVP